MKMIIILLSIFFSVCFAIRNGYQREEAGIAHNLYNRKWHRWEFLVKLCFALIIFLTSGTWFHGIFGFLMVASIDFAVFPLVLNLRTGQHWYYLSDSGIDKFLKKIPAILLILIKLVLLVVSVTYYLKNPF